MDFTWFRRKGWFYLPVSFAGWLIFLVALIYAVDKFIDIDKESHSGSDTLINWFFHLLMIGAVYALIAHFTSKKQVNSPK